MLEARKTLDTHNNSLTNDLSEEDDLDDYYKDHKMDTVVRQKQVIYWPNLAIRRRNNELRDLYRSSSFVKLVNSRRLRCADNITRIWKPRNAHKIFMGNLLESGRFEDEEGN